MNTITRSLLASALSIATVFPALAENGTPPCLYVPRAYQGWKPAEAPVLNPVPGSERKYEGYVNISGAGHLQYVDNPFLGYNPNLKDLIAPADGTYTVTLDLHVSGTTPTRCCRLRPLKETACAPR